MDMALGSEGDIVRRARAAGRVEGLLVEFHDLLVPQAPITSTMRGHAAGGGRPRRVLTA
eukprot:CAMPEP_0176306968 /NCGR_PEP_ID=MMETSP0121_2-20121125/63771_1 /TAXON_ID=160619 /ORGANISM="Kryptoperidinium foliaceum, Strain CCMP 1326" /LENGTH=58 /DNA_ID=CAMNT_0017648725 /DNA_START=69 /DNA_END=241 /DNA_ORIENTATION=-